MLQPTAADRLGNKEGSKWDIWISIKGKIEEILWVDLELVEMDT